MQILQCCHKYWTVVVCLSKYVLLDVSFRYETLSRVNPHFHNNMAANPVSVELHFFSMWLEYWFTELGYVINATHEHILSKPISQIPQCTFPIYHSTHIRTEMCTFRFRMAHLRICNRCILGSENLVYWYNSNRCVDYLWGISSRNNMYVISGPLRRDKHALSVAVSSKYTLWAAVSIQAHSLGSCVDASTIHGQLCPGKHALWAALSKQTQSIDSCVQASMLSGQLYRSKHNPLTAVSRQACSLGSFIEANTIHWQLCPGKHALWAALSKQTQSIGSCVQASMLSGQLYRSKHNPLTAVSRQACSLGSFIEANTVHWQLCPGKHALWAALSKQTQSIDSCVQASMLSGQLYRSKHNPLAAVSRQACSLGSFIEANTIHWQLCPGKHALWAALSTQAHYLGSYLCRIWSTRIPYIRCHFK